jgi:protein gp37
MAEQTKIEWCDYTFNPWWGCEKVSEGCAHCYADAVDARFAEERHWGKDAPRRFFKGHHWGRPRFWHRKCERDGTRAFVFCASMCDVFEDRKDLDAPRHRLFNTIQRTPRLIWLLLTKRPENLKFLLPWVVDGTEPWPHVFLGVTAENQKRADERIPILLNTPACGRFISYEPSLEEVNFRPYMPPAQIVHYCSPPSRGIDWLIAGAESGPKARPAELDWFRSARDQCVEFSVPFFFKQKIDQGKKVSLPFLDGKRWAEFPEVKDV